MRRELDKIDTSNKQNTKTIKWNWQFRNVLALNVEKRKS